jgi:hypothetical protein
VRRHEFVTVAIALAQQNRRREIAIRNVPNVHESRQFKRVKQKCEQLHGKPNQFENFMIQNQELVQKHQATSG